MQYIRTEEIPAIIPTEKIPSNDTNIQTNINAVNQGNTSKESIKKIEEKDNPENKKTEIDNK